MTAAVATIFRSQNRRAVGEAVGGDDLAVVAFGCIDVVVVKIQTRLCQASGLPGINAGLRRIDLGRRVLQCAPRGDHRLVHLVAGRLCIEIALDLAEVGLPGAGAQRPALIEWHRQRQLQGARE